MDFLCNPFYILTAATQDSRQRIMELEDRCSLAQNPVRCREAAANLIHPRRRLRAETAWLPLKNSEQAEKICELLKSSEGNLGALDKLKQVQNRLGADELMPIAKCNVLAAGLSRLPVCPSDEIATWLFELAWISEDINAEEVRAVINTDRNVAGFPRANLPHIEAEIQNLRDYYRQVMTSALGNLSVDERAEALNRVVEPATDDEKPTPRLIDRLVDWYEVDANAYLEEHETKIRELDEKLRLAADEKHPDSALAALINQLTDAINNWHAVAHPIQISKKIKGLPDEDSTRVAWPVRDLAIHLFHDYSKLSFCQQLIVILQAVFAEVVEISEVLAKHTRELEKITGVRTPKAPNSTVGRRELRARRDIEIRVRKLRKLLTAADSDMDFILALENGLLIQSVKKWKNLTQPITASNADCRHVANLVRELALFLWKEHGELGVSLQLLKMLQEEFARVREIAAIIAGDLKALEASKRARIQVQIQVQAEKLRVAADAKQPDSVLSEMVNHLIQAVNEWETLTQPFESYRADYYSVANLAIELALYLWRECGKLDCSRQLLKMLQKVFADVHEIATLISRDITALESPERARLDVKLQAVKLRAAADAKQPDPVLSEMVNQLIQAVNEWKALAQPIKAYSADYYHVAYLVQELARHLLKEHGKLDNSRLLFKMLQQEFAEVDQIAALVAEHLDALEAVESACRHIEIQVKGLRDIVYAKHYHPDLSPMVNQLIQSVKGWRELAQPIKAYCGDYCSVAKLVLELAVNLRNKGKLRSSRQLTEMLQDIFGEIPEIATLLAEDAKTRDETVKKHAPRVAKERSRRIGAAMGRYELTDRSTLIVAVIVIGTVAGLTLMALF